MSMPTEPGEAYRELGYGAGGPGADQAPAAAPGAAGPRDIGPWRVYRGDRPTLHAGTLKQARELADLAQPTGFIEIEHSVTGEWWVRRAAEWRRTR